MVKRATRYKAEIVNPAGQVVWEVLAHHAIPHDLAAVITSYGYTYRRASEPTTEPVGPNYSELDPENSIRGALEFAARRDTARGRVISLLLANIGVWVPRHKVRAVGGDSGDRRVRELRTMGWPIEMSQLDRRDSWHVRLVIPAIPNPT